MTDPELVLLPYERGCWWQFLYAFENGLRRYRITNAGVLSQCAAVDSDRKSRQRDDALDLRRECQLAFYHPIVKWFDADSVARQNQFSLLRIPKRDGKHSLEVSKKVLAIFLVQMHENLGVAVGLETVASIDQHPSQALIVIYLAIVNDPYRAIFVMNRLVTAFEIDNRQATHSEDNVSILEKAMVVRPPMNDGIGHAMYIVQTVTATVVFPDYAYDAAHNESLMANS